jgi:transcriptional regulator with XRE-family HTH domain
MQTEVHKNKFGTRLKNIRDSREITFETAAISTNIDKCRLLDIELNYVVPDAEEVLSLCKLYHIGVERIIKEG